MKVYGKTVINRIVEMSHGMTLEEHNIEIGNVTPGK